jgi:hypothetical protein
MSAVVARRAILGPGSSGFPIAFQGDVRTGFAGKAPNRSFRGMDVCIAAKLCASRLAESRCARVFVVMGYLIGQVAQVIPVAGGIGAIDAGVIGVSASTAPTSRAQRRVR